MNTASIVVLGGVLCLLGLSIWNLRKSKTGCGCGNCTGCPMNCKKNKL